jgi:short-subunit dehydrogenase
VSTALVTGASRGIGQTIARALCGAGYTVIGTSRAPGSLSAAERLPGVRYLPLDLASEPSIDALVTAAGEIDVLINNAGQSQIGAIEEVPLHRMRALFEANLFGALSLTRRILPSMRSRRSGRIVTIASFAAVTPVPFLSMYAASKAALVAAFKGLRCEVAPWGIRVSVVAPFDVHTTIPLDVCYDERSAYLPTIAEVRTVRDKGLAEAPGPEVISAAVLRILRARRPRFFTPAGRAAGASAFLLKHLPESTVESIVRRSFHLPRA